MIQIMYKVVVWRRKFKISFKFVMCLSGGTYETVVVDNVYKVITKLIIIPLQPSDFGAYKCVAKNSVGQAEKILYLYREYKYLQIYMFLGKNLGAGCWIYLKKRILTFKGFVFNLVGKPQFTQNEKIMRYFFAPNFV